MEAGLNGFRIKRVHYGEFGLQIIREPLNSANQTRPPSFSSLKYRTPPHFLFTSVLFFFRHFPPPPSSFSSAAVNGSDGGGCRCGFLRFLPLTLTLPTPKQIGALFLPLYLRLLTPTAFSLRSRRFPRPPAAAPTARSKRGCGPRRPHSTFSLVPFPHIFPLSVCSSKSGDIKDGRRRVR